MTNRNLTFPTLLAVADRPVHSHLRNGQTGQVALGLFHSDLRALAQTVLTVVPIITYLVFLKGSSTLPMSRYH